ncbi:uncharacterized protein LOC128641669 [Bombina bombina]|uniref:uncharacterized protein LOC128641669 n=1 Tax=Bombina bombina TaxID=8345 RepID=UPI00235AB7CE|nr:uncharacterized protein LOC128641669 [Bombina bombina]
MLHITDPAKLTAIELADYTLVADFLQNTTLLTSLLSQILEFKDYDTLQGYLQRLQTSVCQNTESSSNISSCNSLEPLHQLSIHSQQEILTKVFTVLHYDWSLNNMSGWLHIFDILISDFFIALNETHISQLPLNISCENYQAIIRRLSSVYNNINNKVATSVYSYCKLYLTQQLKSTGIACVYGTNSSNQWIELNFGQFSALATNSELLELYPKPGIPVLPEILTPTYVAELLSTTDILTNETSLKTILIRLDPVNITDYVNAFSTAAEKGNISDSQLTTVNQVLLEVTLIKINSSYSSYETQDWKILFQNQLVLLLPYFDQTLLQLLPVDIDCSSYQEIVKGFNIEYANLSPDTQVDVYINFIKRYLTQQLELGDVACETINLNIWINNNFGKFSIQLTTEDIILFNKNFEKITDPAKLTAIELADYTLVADFLQNTTLLTSLLSQILEFKDYDTLQGYLQRLQTSVCQNTESSSNISSCNSLEPLHQLSIHSQQDILTKVFTVLHYDWSLNNMSGWLHIFDILISDFFIALNETHISQLPLNISCENYQAIIKRLSSVYNNINDKVATSVYSYCKLYLTQQLKSTGIACVYGTNSSNQWIELNFGQFSALATNSELLELYPKPGIPVLPEILTPTYVAELLSTTDILTNDTSLKTILIRLDPVNITDYVNAFSTAAEKGNISDSQLTTVNQVLLEVTLIKINSSYSSYETQDWKILFQNQLVLLLPYFDQTLLQLLPVDIDCSSYQEIVKGFNIEYANLSPDTQVDVYINFIKRYLTQQLELGDVACETINLNIWINNNFGKFSIQLTTEDIILFNKNVEKITDPAKLTAIELADYTLVADFLQNTTLLTSLLSQILEFKDYDTLQGYLQRLQTSVCQNTESSSNISSCNSLEPLHQLSIHSQQEILTKVFTVLHYDWSLNNMSGWLHIFDILISDFFIALNETHISQLPLNISCENYQAIIKRLSSVYNNINDKVATSVYSYCKLYLTQQLKSTGIACVYGTNSSNQWIELNFGQFSALATNSELLELYPKPGIPVLPEILTPTYVAELLSTTDILTNETSLKTILIRLDPVNITDYVNAFSTAAEKGNISDSQLTTVNQVLLEVTLIKINSSYSSYETQDWKILFQNQLVLLLPNFNQTLLQLLPVDINCSSYQEIVKGFSIEYTNLSIETRVEVYNNFIKRYLTQQLHLGDVACESTNLNIWIYNNFGNFSIQLTTEDIVLFNKQYEKITNPAKLTATELADYTLVADSLQNSTFLISLLSQILEFKDYDTLQGYLQRLQTSVCRSTGPSSNISSCEPVQSLSKLSIHTQQEILTNVFTVLSYDWSLNNMSSWLHIFDILISDFLIALNETHLSQLPLNISCGNYQSIIKKLSNVYEEITDTEAASVYSYCKLYLTQKIKSTGFACVYGTTNSSQWIELNFGQFSVLATVSQLLEQYPKPDIPVLPEILTPTYVTKLLTTTNIFTNETSLKTVLTRLNPENITEYVNAFSTAAEKGNISDSQLTILKQALLELTLIKLNSSYSSYETQDWKILFQNQLVLLLPNFNQTLLQLLPVDINCSSYQEIVKGFSIEYTNLSIETRVEVYNNFIKRYLTQQLHLGDVACESTNLNIWIYNNFGNFSIQLTTEDIVLFNKQYEKITNPAKLTATELADYTLVADSLQNSTFLISLLSQILEFKDYDTLQGYLQRLQTSVCRSTGPSSNISSCEPVQSLSKLSIHTQQEILTNVFTVLSYDWSLNNMSSWLHIFDILISDFLIALNETHLSQLPLNISCGNYQSIIKKLSNVYEEITDTEAASVYSYCKLYLTQKIKSTGFACVYGTTNSSQWIELNFGQFSVLATVSQLLEQYPKPDIPVLPEILTPTYVTKLLTTTNIFTNETSLKTVLTRLNPENITEYVNAFSTAAEKGNISDSQLTILKQALLELTLIKLNSSYSSYETQDWKILFQNQLVLLLPNFNQTLLQLLPVDINCSSYQEIVKGFSIEYTNLSIETRVEVYNNFIKRYLTQQLHLGDVACESTNLNIWIYNNFGNFSIQLTTEDIVLFNNQYEKITNPAKLTATELADYTLVADSLQNSTFLISLLSQILEFKDYDTLQGYLQRLQTSVCQSTGPSSNISSCEPVQSLSKLSIHTQQEILTNVFTVLSYDWSLNNMSSWLHIFDILISDFLNALNETHLSQLPLNISCENYQSIIKKLSNVYEEITDTEAASVYSYCKLYLTQKIKSTGFACVYGTTNSSQWIELNFGQFSVLATVSQLLELYPKPDIPVLPEILTPTYVTELLTTSNIFTNETSLKTILTRLNPENITEYVNAFSTAAEKGNISESQLTILKQALLEVTLIKLNSSYSSYETQDWKILFQNQLVLLLPNFNQTLLQLLPVDINCSSYQEIVKGFSIEYTNLSREMRVEVYNNFIKRYLTEQLHSGDVACESINLNIWIYNNFGNFSIQLTTEDIVLFNKKYEKITDPAKLTATELADYTFVADSLQNSTLVTSLLSQILKFKDYDTLQGYLQQLQNSVCQSTDPSSNISYCEQLQSISKLTIHIQQEILTNVFTVLGYDWSLNNMTGWLQIFDILDSDFLISLNETHISQLPLNISCENYQSIIKKLSNVYNNITDKEASSVFSYCIQYLTQQLKFTGFACSYGTNNSNQWIELNFGQFSSLATVLELKMFFQNQLVPLFPNFDQTLLQLLPVDFDCSSYQEIVKGFSIKYAELSTEKQDAVYSNFIKRYLTQQLQSAVVACDAINVNIWIQINLGNFSRQLKVEDLVLFNNKMEKIINTSKLTTTELADYTLIADSLQNSTLSTNLLSQIKEFKDYNMLQEYIQGLKKSICQNINSSSDTSSCDQLQPLVKLSTHTQWEILTNGFIVLGYNWSLSNMSGWLPVFDILITDFIIVLDETHISRLPLEISCQDYQAIIKRLSGIFDKINDKTATSVYEYGKLYLTQQYAATGYACDSSINNNTEWIKLNFGNFSTNATASKLENLYLELHISTLPDILTPNEMAYLLTQVNVLANETKLTATLGTIDPEHILDYVNAFSIAAAKVNISVEQIATVKYNMLRVILEKIKSNFSSYQTENWKNLFQIELVSLIPYFNQSLLRYLPTSVTCPSYQEIVKGFNILYGSLSNDTKKSVYTFYIKTYLTEKALATGIACETTNFTTWVEVNFGKFFQEASTGDIAEFNKNFRKIDTSLTAAQLAEFTTIAELLNNLTLANSIPSYISRFKTYEELNDYLSNIKTSLCKILNLGLNSCSLEDVLSNTTKRLILSNSIVVLKQEWSLKNVSLWLEVFNILVETFVQEIIESDIIDLPKNISCETAEGIVKSLNGRYEKLTLANQNATYKYLLVYHNESKLKCDTTGNLQDFITKYFLKFSTLLSATDLVSIIPETKLQEKLSTLPSHDLINYLQSNESSSLWAVLLSSYTNITKLGEVLDGLEYIMVNKSDEIRKTLFTAVWQNFVNATGSLSSNEQSKWLNYRLTDYLPLLTKAQLNVPQVINANCTFYMNLVKTLTIHYSNYTTSTLQDIYDVFKTYLLNSETKPRCYSESGSSSWIFTYLGDYLTFCSAEDLKSFTNNETLLQTFSLDEENLKLVTRLNISEDLKQYYAELLVAKNPSISLNSIPPNILCYAIDKLRLDGYNESQALSLLEILKQCGNNVTNVLAPLLNSVKNITAETFVSLGPLATGLPSSVILQNVPGNILQANLESLSNYTWSTSQASAITTQLIQSGFTFNYSSLISLGSLVVGIQTNVLDKLDNNELLKLTAMPSFVSFMEQAPLTIKQRFVQMILKITSENVLQLVPDSLASEIPSSQLLSSNIDITEINKKHWTPQQATIFFKVVLTKIQNYTQLSTYVLQGFTGGATKNITDDSFTSLIQSMKSKSVKLDNSQLSYITRRLTKNGNPGDFEKYPSDVLLYIGSSTYDNSQNCKIYFSLVGQSNIDLLPQGSSKRTSLLNSAKACLNISSENITKENLQVLGSLSCDLSDQEINSSDPYILNALQSCSSFTAQQKVAIERQILLKYGPANTWTISTLTGIGNLAGSLTSNVLNQVPTTVRLRFFPDYLTTIKKKDKISFSFTMSQLKMSTTRMYRAITCDNKITTDVITKQKELLVLSYTSSELENCLDVGVVKDNLDILGGLEFSDDQLTVLKKKLDEIFPNGVSEEYLMVLGNIARMYTAEEIAKWNITKVDTLATLLEKATWQSNDSKVNTLVTRYLLTPTASLDGTTLTSLAPYICSLSEEQIRGINANEIKSSTKSPDISACPQSKRTLIFEKYKNAYQSLQMSQNAYFQIMKPVIGGAKTGDLVQFAAGFPEMDIDIFATLNPAEVKNVTAQDIKNLLGENLPDIIKISNSYIVQLWVSGNAQTDVNSLGLNLLAGVIEPLPNGFISIVKPVSSKGTSPIRATSVFFTCMLMAVIPIAIAIL